VFLLCFSSVSADEVNVDTLDAAAVTIKASGGEGSGSIIIKEMVVDSDGTKEPVTFCLTAAHVIARNRSISTKIKDGKEIKVIEFSDPGLLQEIHYKGRNVGEVKLSGKVVRYSDADKGHDIAVIMLYSPDKFKDSVKFEQDTEYIPPKGMKVIHIGSSNGQIGSNSFTSGNISQTGRLLNVGSGSGFVFDQTSAPAEPGSSGCMIVRESDGVYIGMLVRGGSSTFNFIVPVRRLHEWSEEVDAEFLFKEDAEVPTLKEFLKHPIEN
jgi:S1-C subfamily serine protease